MSPVTLQIDALTSFTLAILLLFCGKYVVGRSEVLQRYCIPEPVIGGLLCALAVGLAYFKFDLVIEFDLDVRDTLLLYFFAGIGLRSDLRDLLKGGRPLLALTVLSGFYILLQNGAGMGVASLFGLDPKAGLMLGSVSLTGGVGTTLAWAPLFAKDGVGNAMELGIAGNTVGIIAACVIGGPLAQYLIARHRLAGSGDSALETGVINSLRPRRLTHYDVLRSWLWLNIALMVGRGIHALLQASVMVLPEFVSCLIAGILIRNLAQWLLGAGSLPKLGLAGDAMPLISDICLGMFLTMALMGLQLWLLGGMLDFLAITLLIQIVLAILFAIFVVFRSLGGNYEACVMVAGFSGIALGSTATAIVNMSAVTRKYGAAHQAFVVVPMVCGFFIDITNALMIGLCAGI